MAIELRYYQTAAGEKPFVEWLQGLKDRQARTRDSRRASPASQLAISAGEGVLELRIDWGPGYRVYFARLGQVVVLLLCGGDKRAQQKDIDRAKAYLEDYKARTTRKKPRGRR